MDIPYPSQHTMSSNHRPASEMSFECLRCCITKKEKRKAGGRCVCVGGGGGGGVGGCQRATLKPIQFLWCFIAFVVVVFVRLGGGGK